MEGNKRKRDSSDDISRPAQITFHADTRAFERLFKERSLGELKLAVRRKLGLADGTFVKLKQMRFDTLIDLDDDDDFEALRVHASRTLLPIDIKVIVQQGTSQDPHTNSTSAVVDLPRPSTLAAVPSELATKKRKIAIEDSVTSETAVPTTPPQSQLAREATKAKGRKRKVKAGDADVSAATTSDPTKGVEKASADTGPTSQEKGVGPPKKKQKRAKDVVPPQTGETSEMGELPSVGPSSIPKVSQSRDIGPEKEKVAIRDLAAGNQDKVIPLATKKQKSSKTSKQKDPLGKQSDDAVSSIGVIEERPSKFSKSKEDKKQANKYNKDGEKASDSVIKPEKAKGAYHGAAGSSVSGDSKTITSVMDQSGSGRGDSEIAGTSAPKKSSQKKPVKVDSRSLEKKESGKSDVAIADKPVINQSTTSNPSLLDPDSWNEFLRDFEREVAQLQREGDQTAAQSEAPKKPKVSKKPKKSAPTTSPSTSALTGKDISMIESYSIELLASAHRNEDAPNSTAGPQRPPAGLHCPICLEKPFHVRYECPIVLEGSDAIQKRLDELRRMDLSDQRALVEELEGILRRRANKDKVVAATTAPPPLTPVPLTPQEGQSRNTSMSPVPRPPVLPGNSHPLEVAVESADEGLSSDSEEESDQGTPSTKRPTTVAESYGDDVLEAVIRGPAPRRGLSSMWKELREEEEEKEKVQLEEEDCARQQRGHTSQRLSRSSQETGGETSESLRDSVTGDGDIPGESSSGAKFATQGQLPQQADEGGYGERIPLEQCDTKQTTIQKESKLVTVVEESPCNETGESSSSGNSAGDDDVDPIEPAEELAYPSEGHFSDVDPIEPNTPASDIEKIIVLVNHSTPKYPVSKRMKTRGGAVLDDAELPVPVSTLISEAKDMITPLPEQRGPRKKVNGLSSSQEVIRTRRARSSDPLSSTAPVPCVSNDKEKGDSTPVMLQGKTPKSIIKSMLNGKEKKIAAPSTRTSSLVAWETMREPTPSVQSDELAPSSPQREDILTSAVGKSSEIINDPKSNSDTNSDDDDTDAEDVQPRKGKEPLFDLTASQIPFPYSQYSTPAVSSLQSSVNPEDRGKEVKQPPRKRTLGKSGVGTYRSLTELASEASSLFSPSLPTTTGKGTTNNRGPKKNASDTESEDSSSSSESDDPTGSTHIPRGRRASSVLPSKKKRGLLDGL